MPSEVIALLSSSPGFEIQNHNVTSRAPYQARSSPPLPSPRSILRCVDERQKLAISPGRRIGTVVSSGESRGFRSARTLAFESGPDSNKGRRGSEGELQVKELKVVKKRAKKDVSEKKPKVAKKPAKPRGTKVAENKNKEDDSSKPLAELSDIAAIAAEKKVPKPRKPRQKKQVEADQDEQPKLKRARVTKPGVTAAKVNNVTDTVSAFFDQRSGLEVGGRDVTAPAEQAQKSPEVTLEQDEVSIHAEESIVPQAPALTRKRDWTPPPDTVQVFEDENRSGQEEHSGDEQSGLAAFGDLQNSFGYNDQTTLSEPVPQRTKSGQAFKKKRRVDVVKAPKAKVKATPKPRAPAKSSRTITAIAIGQYGPAVVDADKLAADTVSAFFAPRTEGVEGYKPTTEPDTAPAKRKRKSTAAIDGTARSKTKKPKKAAEAIPKLLSPETAMRRLDNQDLLFGTSSQLVRDESPQFIRELQQAMEESAAHEQVPIARHITRKIGANGSVTTVIRVSGGLWSLSTRDDGDELLPAEKREAKVKERAAAATAPLERLIGEQENLTNGITILEETGKLNNAIEKTTEELPTLEEVDLVTNESGTEDPAGMVLELDKRAKLSHKTTPEPKTVSKPPAKRLKLATAKKSNKSALLIAPRIPSPQRQPLQPLPSNTNNILAPIEDIRLPPKSHLKSPSKLTSPSKTRTKPSFLLAPTDSIPAEPPTTPRRSRKSPAILLSSPPIKPASPPKQPPTLPQTPPHSSASFKDIDMLLPLSEIEDSEPERTPSPPRRRRSPTKTTTSARERRSPPLPRPLTLSPSRAARPQQATPPRTRLTSRSPTKVKKAPNPPTAAKVAQFTTTLQATLFPLIKRAVLSAPRTHDQSRPGWYEKILLYDPIVLEDLCGWLNAGALFDGVVEERGGAVEGRGNGMEKRVFRDAVEKFESRKRKVDDDVDVDVDVNAEAEAEAEAQGEGHDDINGGGDDAPDNQTPAAAAGQETIETQAQPPKKIPRKRKGKEKEVDDDGEEWTWELKPWMLQRWCEEHSICCLWREGLRGGVKAKY